MDPYAVLLIAVGLAMDAFAVSLAYGLSFRRREHRSALKIAGAFGVFQAAMPVLGWFAGLAFRRWIEAVDHWVAFGLLAVIGGKMILDAVRTGPEAEPTTSTFTWRALLVLAIATSIDALAVGLALSLLAVAILLPVLVIGVVTFVLSYLGIVLGYELTSWLRDRGRRVVQVVGGLILIGIGLKILFEHLGAAGGA